LAAREIEMNNARLEELASPGAPRPWTDLLQQWADSYVLCDTRRLTAALGLLEERARSEDPAIREQLPIIRYLLHCCRGMTFVHMEEAAFPPESATHVCAVAQTAVLAAVAGDFAATRKRARLVVSDAPSHPFNEGHILYVRLCDAFAELKIAAADPEADLSGALEQLDAQWATFETWNKGGRFLASSVIQCAFAADAAVDVARHRSLPAEKRGGALERAQRAIDWATSRLANQGMEQMHRYFIPELHRARGRMAAAAGHPAEAAKAFEDARHACSLLAEQGETPTFLMDRIASAAGILAS
jgi:hypothetical protein